MFIGEGRKAFLEFLRNLTPQILFLTISLISGSKLDLTQFDFSGSGLWNAFPFAMCLIVFFGAAIANIGLFIENAITSNPALDGELEEIKSKAVIAWKRTWLCLCAAWKHNKPAFVEIILALAICEIAFVVVFIVAIQGAIASPLIAK